MIDIFAEDGDLGVEQSVARFHALNFRDQLLGGGMFDFGFIEKIIVLYRLARRGIINLLLDLGMNGERKTDLVDNACFSPSSSRLSYCLK